MNTDEPGVCGSRAHRRWVVALLMIGAGLQVANWLVDRALWNDEIAVALNLESRSWGELAGRLAHKQVAPVGFLWLTKASAELFGPNERAYRFVSLLAGLVALPLAWAWLRRCLLPTTAVVALALLVVQPRLIEFSAELKPYTCDVAAGLTVLLLDLRLREQHFSGRRWVAWVVAGCVLPWVSFPVVFVLGAVGVCDAFTLLRLRRWRTLAFLTLIGAAWAASALVQLRLIHTAADDTYLQSFWAGHFWPWDQGVLRMIGWPFVVWAALLRDPMKSSIPWLAPAAAAVGVVALLRNPLFRPALTLFAFALLAAAAHRYPLGDRLALYLLPFLAATLAFLPGRWLSHPHRRWRIVGLILLGLLLADPVGRSAKNLVKPRRKEEVRGVLQQLATRARPGDQVYVYAYSSHSYQYYAPRSGVQLPATFGNTAAVTKDPQLPALLQHPRVWVYVAHGAKPRDVELSPEFLQSVGASVQPAERLESLGAAAVLYARPAR